VLPFSASYFIIVGRQLRDSKIDDLPASLPRLAYTMGWFSKSGLIAE